MAPDRADGDSFGGTGLSPPPTDPILQPGTTVGEYRITHCLGQGGMGVVYAAVHPEIGKKVAIKVLAPQAAQHPDLIRRFKEEARAVNKIGHPNIIDIFAFNQLSDGRHYFVMEYLDGESLTARLQRGWTDLPEVRRLLAQMCSALQAAHDAGIIHRDFKPDNVWVATPHLAQPEIKLLDFGIAKLNDGNNVKATQTGAPIGTPHYMAPEQAMGRAVDCRADIYALGVVLYEIFTGRLPFDGATVHEIVFKHMTEAPVPPSSFRAIVPPGMEAIILDCLQKEPARRPASMLELSQRIESAFAGDTGRQPRAGAVMGRPLASAPTLRAPAPGRTELLPDAPPMASRPLQKTTPFPTPPPPPRPTARFPWAGAFLALALVGALAVGVRALGRRAPDAALAPAVQEAAHAVPSAPHAAVDLPAEPVAPAHETVPHQPPEVAPPPPAAAEPPHRTSRREQRSRPAHKPPREVPASAAQHGGAANPPPSPAAKPNCNPNYYLDADGDKHFKPECF